MIMYLFIRIVLKMEKRKRNQATFANLWLTIINYSFFGLDRARDVWNFPNIYSPSIYAIASAREHRFRNQLCSLTRILTHKEAANVLESLYNSTKILLDSDFLLRVLPLCSPFQPLNISRMTEIHYCFFWTFMKKQKTIYMDCLC